MTVSGWIKTIRETVPPGERFAAAQALVETLGQRAKARNAEWRRIQAGIADGSIKPKAATPTPGLDATPSQRRSDGRAPGVDVGGSAASPGAVGEGGSPTPMGVAMGTTPSASVRGIDAGGPGQARAGTDASDVASATSVAKGDETVAAGAPMTPTGRDAPSRADGAGPTTTTPVAADARFVGPVAPGVGDRMTVGTETAGPESDADAERRRREREEEIEARKKKRKAVLGRRNRVKER